MTRLRLITDLILSDLDYCNLIFLGCSYKSIKSLQHVLNKAVRFIINTKPYEHITPYLKQLHILPIVYRIKFKSSLICFKIINKTAPDYLLENFQTFTHNTKINLRMETGNGRDQFMFINNTPARQKETILTV